MRRKFTLTIIAVCMSLIGSARHFEGESKLNLTLGQGGTYTVYVDDVRYDHVAGHLNVHGLQPGTHRIRVVEQAYRRGHGRGHRHARFTAFNGLIDIPYRSMVFAHITPGNGLYVDRIQPIRRQPVRNSRPHRPSQSYNRSGAYHVRPFEDAVRSIELANFERDKLQIAKQYVRNNGTSPAEVRDIMYLFTFDASRLEFAQFAYKYSRNQENYFIVNDAFTYSSSIRELDHFLSRQNRRR